MGISVQRISKRFNGFVAVDQVSFEVAKGELVALLGPSGCGKSTILRIISGLERPDSGNVFLNNSNVNRLTPQQRRVGFVFQHYALFKHMTVEKNIAFGLEIKKKRKPEIATRVAELLELIGLTGYRKHYPAQLSGGQRQRVALARALASEPKVLLLDEPFGALDVKVRENLTGWLRRLHDKLNTTSIFVTHDQREAMDLADRIVVVNQGRIEQTGIAPQVYEKPRNKFVAGFIGNANVLDGICTDGAVYLKRTPYKIENRSAPATGKNGIMIFVRPEDIDIQATNRGNNAFPAVITHINYRGSYRELDLKAQGLNIKAFEYKNRKSAFSWQQNQTVFIKFNNYKIFERPVFNYGSSQKDIALDVECGEGKHGQASNG